MGGLEVLAQKASVELALDMGQAGGSLITERQKICSTQLCLLMQKFWLSKGVKVLPSKPLFQSQEKGFLRRPARTAAELFHVFLCRRCLVFYRLIRQSFFVV